MMAAEKMLMSAGSNPDDLEVLRRIVQPEFNMLSVINGYEVLLAAEKNKPDIILIDIMIPDLDGYKLCQQLKSNRLTRDIPVIFWGEINEIKDEYKGLEAGAADYIFKPFRPALIKARINMVLQLEEKNNKLEKLSDKMRRYLSPQMLESVFSEELAGSNVFKLSQSSCVSVGFADKKIYSGNQVLVVDDSSYNLKLIEEMLTQAGYIARPVLDGKTALASIEKSLPDIILLDIMMPAMSGYEVCTRLKADHLTRHIPVIFLSALDETIDKVKAFECGGADYVTKPFQKMELLARIKTHLALSNLRREIEQRNAELQEALANIQTLRGLLPICAHCKKIRDHQGSWHPMEAYISTRSEVKFSHGICPECRQEFYQDKD